jgi:hypothetical protein
LRLAPLGKLRLDLFLTVHQGLDAALARPGLERIERLLDAAQGHMQRHAHLLPTLDERPVDRAQEQVLAAAADEGVFDLCEVVEVVQGRVRRRLFGGLRLLGSVHRLFVTGKLFRRSRADAKTCNPRAARMNSPPGLVKRQAAGDEPDRPTRRPRRERRGQSEFLKAGTLD